MNMISYMNDNPVDCGKARDQNFHERPSFDIGVITAVNSDKTLDLKSIRSTALSSITSMSTVEENPTISSQMLFLNGRNSTTLHQCFSRSPYLISGFDGK